jgi:hypothetical protein
VRDEELERGIGLARGWLGVGWLGVGWWGVGESLSPQSVARLFAGLWPLVKPNVWRHTELEFLNSLWGLGTEKV